MIGPFAPMTPGAEEGAAAVPDEAGALLPARAEHRVHGSSALAGQLTTARAPEPGVRLRSLAALAPRNQ